MNQVRGVIMIALGAWMLYMGWHNYTGNRSLFAYGFGGLAVAVGVWRLTRKNSR
jgi:hypothetical protein